MLYLQRVSVIAFASVLLAGIGCSSDDTGNRKGDSDGAQCVLDESSPVLMGGIFALGGSATSARLGAEEAELVQKAINDGCGVMGDDEKGIAVSIGYVDGEDIVETAKTRVDDLVAAGNKAIIGAGNSGVTTAAATQAVVVHGVPFGAHSSRGLNLDSCTPDELVDSNITKMENPTSKANECWDNHGLFVRARGNAVDWVGLVVEYMHSHYPLITTAATMSKGSSGQLEARKQFKPLFEAIDQDNTVTAEIENASEASQVQFVGYIQDLVAGNPQAVFASLTPTELVNFLNAWVELGADAGFTKPSNYDTIRIYLPMTMSDVDLSGLTPAAKTFASTNVESSENYWDASLPGTQAWLQMYADYFVDDPNPVSFFQASSFDLWMVFALAMTRAGSTEPADIAASIREVANPPGTVYYPDQYAEARAALLRGEDIDYEGPAISDFDEYGNVPSPLLVRTINADTSLNDVGIISPANPEPH